MYTKIVKHSVEIETDVLSYEALSDMKRRMYVNFKGLATARQPVRGLHEVSFFQVKQNISCSELVLEYKQLQLRPVDLLTLAVLNYSDPDFSDKHPNVTQWSDKEGKYWGAIFNKRRDVRCLEVCRREFGWGRRGNWWFAGVDLNTFMS